MADCTTTTITTCELPEFCAAGSAVCLYNAITGDITAIAPACWLGQDDKHFVVNDWCGILYRDQHERRHLERYDRHADFVPITQVTMPCDNADPDEVEDDFTDRVTVMRISSWLEL